MPTGIDRVCLAYLDEFADQSRAVVQYHGYRRVLGRRTSARLFRLLGSPGSDFRRKFVAIMVRSIFEQPGPVVGRLYLNIGHTGLDQDGLGEWIKKTGVRPVYFVHDLIPITHPQFCRSGEQEKHQRRMLTVLETAAGIIGNSQATLDDLAHFARQSGREMPPSITGWLGTEVPPANGNGATEPPTFVALGTIEARKNHMLLLDVWSRLARSEEGPPPKLLLIGQRGWECADVFGRLDKKEFGGSVIELNACSDQQLFDHLAGARALLFPSFAEGFGLPLTEALASGTPVIASDLPVFREIGQGVPELLDTDDPGAWRKAVTDYAAPEGERRRAQVDRMKDFKPYSWRDHFAAIGPWLAKL